MAYKKFYDTSSLLLKLDDLFNSDEKIYISSITLNELENIKTASYKDNDIKYSCRKLLKLISDNEDLFEIIVFKQYMLDPFITDQLAITEDLKILATAYYLKENAYEELIFVTEDLALYNIAKLYFPKKHIERVTEVAYDEYDGYREIILTDEELAEFYSHPNTNYYNLLDNEYLIIYNLKNEIVDRLCWVDNHYRHLSYEDFNSKFFGKVKPYCGDIYQAMFADSLSNNQITMVKGPAGSGKTYLSLAYLMSKLEKGEIDRIIVFCNTVATKGSAKLGYYPGDRNEKLLDSQIGNLLSSKFGDKIVVESMIEKGTLVLLPLSDIRGYDTSGMNAGIYISEAQNMDVALMKLVLQRIGEDSICIIDGDFNAQVDDNSYAGYNNGMKRASKVFRNHNIYGEVTLKHIYRSKIAEIAENL